MANETKFVVPRLGCRIRYPKSPHTILLDSGDVVPWIGPEGRFWRRRNNDGSIDVYEDKAAFDRFKDKPDDKPKQTSNFNNNKPGGAK